MEKLIELLFITILVIALLATGIVIYGAFTGDMKLYTNYHSYEYKKAQVAECIADKIYSRDECIILISGNHD